MKPRGLKQHLSMLREAGVASASFHPDGALAAVSFRGPPPVAKRAPDTSPHEERARARTRVAAELGVDEDALATVLAQVPETEMEPS